MTKDLEEKVEEKTEKKKINPLLIVLLLIVFVGLLIGAFILGTKFTNKEDEVNKEQQYTLDIYEFTYGLCEKESSKCKKIDSIPVKTKEAKILTSYEESKDDTSYHVKHILYNDETVKLYNLETKKITETNLKAEYDEYELQMSYDSKEVLGIILYKDSSNSNDYNVYYDIKNQKKLLESQYDQIYAMRGEYIQVVQDQKDIIDRGDFDWDNSVSYVINTTTQQRIVSESTSQVTFETSKVKDRIYIFKRYHGLHEQTSAVYNSDGKVLMQNLAIGQWGFTKEGHIYKVNENKVVTIDYQGTILSSSKEYKNILHVEKDEQNFILYDDGKNVYITDEENYTIKVIEKKRELTYLSDHYFELTIEQITEEYPKAGLYFTFLYDDDTEYSPGIKAYFNPETKEVSTQTFKDLYGTE